MRPSCRNAISIEFHTRGLGSANSCNCRASLSDQIEVSHQAGTQRTGFQMRFLFCGPAALNYIRQELPEILRSSYFISPKVPTCCRSSRLCGLFGSARFERLAQFHARLVQLRFAVADGTSHHGGNLVVFVPFYVMQHKNPSISRRQRIYRRLQPQSVDRTRQDRIWLRPVLSSEPLPRFPASLPAEQREGSSCATASGQRLPPSDAARWKTLTRRETWQSCETTAEKLPESGPRLPPYWPSCADTANKRAVYADRTKAEKLLRLPAWLARSPLLRKACRPVVFSRPSSRLFRPH